jgi:hypothetical protein
MLTARNAILELLESSGAQDFWAITSEVLTQVIGVTAETAFQVTTDATIALIDSGEIQELLDDEGKRYFDLPE